VTTPSPQPPAHPTPRSKASCHRDEQAQPLHNFRGLLTHLATLTRNDLRYGDTEITVPTLTDSTPTQRRAFDLINQPMPLTLK
jgi:hypothetical protein